MQWNNRFYYDYYYYHHHQHQHCFFLSIFLFCSYIALFLHNIKFTKHVFVYACSAYTIVSILELYIWFSHLLFEIYHSWLCIRFILSAFVLLSINIEGRAVHVERLSRYLFSGKMNNFYVYMWGRCATERLNKFVLKVAIANILSILLLPIKSWLNLCWHHRQLIVNIIKNKIEKWLWKMDISAHKNPISFILLFVNSD